jgi:hypothetical protein
LNHFINMTRAYIYKLLNFITQKEKNKIQIKLTM